MLLENIDSLVEQASEGIAPGGRCPFLMQEAWISAEGRFSPCCAPDALRRTLGEFGSLNGGTLNDVWRSAAYQDLAATYRTHTLCQDCTMRKPAEESR